MPKPYGLVIFDSDGVLVDSERLLLAVDVQVLAAMGWPLPAEEVVRRFVGRSHADVTAQLAAHLGRELEPDWDRPFDDLYRAAVEESLAPVPGVVAALDRIAVPTCVASSGSHEKLRALLGHCGLYERFAGRVFSAADVARCKPAPDLFLHAAATMGVEPSRCAVVEDSVFGVEAALAAGMDAFAFAGGVTPAAALAVPGAVVFDDMDELPALLA